MVWVVMRDMHEKVFLENEFPENITVYDLKKHLVMEIKKSNSFENVLSSKYADITNDALEFPVFYNKKAVKGDIPVSAFRSGQELCLYFVMEDLLGQQEGSESQEKTEIEVQEIEYVKTKDTFPVYKRVSIVVDERKILKRGEKSYLIIHRRQTPKLLRGIKKLLFSLRKELVIKVSVILLLVAIKNVEIASILAFILVMRFISSNKIRTYGEARNLHVLVLRTVFFFFYTMFIISADDNIQVV